MYNKNNLQKKFTSDNLSHTEALNDRELCMNKKKLIEMQYSEKFKNRKDNGRFYISIRINRKYKQFTAPSYDELVEVLYQFFYAKEKFTLRDIFPEFMRWRRDYFRLSGKTLKEDKNIYDRLIEPYEEISAIPLKELTTKMFTNYFRIITKEHNMTKKGFGNLKGVLNQMMKYAVEEEIILYNPIDAVNTRQFTFRPVKPKKKAYTEEERMAMLKHLEKYDDIYSYAIQFDFYVTMRIGEVQALRWTDIENNAIRVQGQQVQQVEMNDDLSFSARKYETVDHIKGYTSAGFRSIPLTVKSMAILEKVRKLNPDGEFIFMKDGKQLLTDTFNEHLKKHCEIAGIPYLPSHSIRFTTTSILYRNGTAPTELQGLLGHSNLNMTLHYIRPLANTEEVANKFACALG